MARLTFPRYDAPCGWNAMLPIRVAKTLPPPRRHHDAIVIGAGYTGVAAARSIACLRPDYSVLLLESGVVGEGSSGRNAGFAVSVPFNSQLSYEPLSTAERMQLASYEKGLAELESLVQHHRIECAWNRLPKLHAAATAQGEGRLKTLLKSYSKWQIECEEWDSTKISDAVGSNYYRYGFRTGRNVFVQPAALIRGLAECLPDNVHLMENTPVIKTQMEGRKTVFTSAGAFSADRIIIATNAFIKRLGYLRDRIITIYTYAALTPELSPRHLECMGVSAQSGAEWGILPAHRLGTTVRFVGGKRLLFRSAYSYEKELSHKRANELLLAAYRRRFPAMPEHVFEYVWGGATALTSNGEPSFGTLAPSVYCFAGCNGSGIVKGTVYGRLLGELSLGLDSPELNCALDRPAPEYLPPEPFRAIGVHAAINYQAWKAGAER